MKSMLLFQALCMLVTSIRLIDEAEVDIKNETQQFFVEIGQSHSEEIYSVSIGTENGEYYGARTRFFV